MEGAMIFGLKDTDLEWALRALITQLQCLLDDPDLIETGPAQSRELAEEFRGLALRVNAELQVARMGWAPIHAGLNDLVGEAGRRFNDFQLVVLLKLKKRNEEVARTHWDDGVRASSKVIVAELSKMIVDLSA
jgi:hypothetical protein